MLSIHLLKFTLVSRVSPKYFASDTCWSFCMVIQRILKVNRTCFIIITGCTDFVAVYLHHVECLFTDTTGSRLQIDDR